MNNTKWEEIRLAMYDYPLPIQWRTRDVETGYISEWDSEWYHHFRSGGYKTIEWLEIKTGNKKIKEEIIKLLKEIHIPGKVLDDSIKIYGYMKNEPVDYI